MIRSLDSGVKFHGCKVVIYYREVSLIQIEYFDNEIVFIVAFVRSDIGFA